MDPYEHDIVMAGEALREAAEHFIDVLCHGDGQSSRDDYRTTCPINPTGGVVT